MEAAASHIGAVRARTGQDAGVCRFTSVCKILEITASLAITQIYAVEGAVFLPAWCCRWLRDHLFR